MKNLTAKLFAVLAMAITTALSVFGQNGFSYQAVIRNAEGELIANKQVEVKFTLKHDGTNFYSEKQNVKTNEYGNIQVVVGNGEKLDGDFANVPWDSFDVKMEVAVIIDGKGELVLGEIPVNGAPYAMFAQKAGGLTSNYANTKDGDALFAVNDANGNPVFAVFANGIVVYVDDTDTNSSKAVRSGFIVTGRSATKDKAATEYFSVTTEGTRIYVDDATNQDDKAMRSGFVVTGRSASKDGKTADYLTVGGEGTTVYVENDDKAMRSGFVVTGRTATKNDTEPQYFSATADGTTVYVDDSTDKAMRSGFVVTGRTATKDGADNYLAVDGNGTQVFVDGADANKTLRSGFVVTGRSATKDDETIFAIEGGYTRVYIEDDEADNAKRNGFVVTGRSASKDTATTNYLDINKDSINFLATEFNVVERVTETTDTTAQPEPGDTTTTPAPVKPKSLFTINSGNVQIGTEMVMVGEVVKKIDADTISTDTIEAEFPQIAKIVDRADTVSCAAYKPFVYGNDNDSDGYALLGIYSKGKYAKITTTDARNNTVLLIDASGNITKKQKTATVAVLMPEGDSVLYIRPLKATSQTVSFGLMKKNSTEPYQYIKIEAEIETTAGVPYKVTTSSNEGGRVVVDGTVAYGDKPTFEAVPQVGYAFVRWSDGSTQVKHPVTILDDFDISAEFERMSYVVAVKSDNALFGTVSGDGSYWHGDTAYIEAKPLVGYYFNNWSGIELNDSLQNNPSLALEVTSKLNLIAHFGIMQYTITFDTDGGSEVAAITQDYNTKITAPADPQKEGFRFRGWSDTIPERMPAENLTIKAVWGINKYFITVNTDNGAPVDSLAFDFGEAVTTPDDPKREGYTFTGWDKVFPEKMPAEDLIITAQWKVNSHYIIYMVEDTVYKTDSALYGTTIELIAGPGKKGYSFNEWQNAPETMPDNDVTITGSFTAEKYSITYKMNDGNWVEGKKGQEEYTIEDKIYLPAPVKENYNFLGWLYADSTIVQSIAGDTTGNIALTANWTPSPYQIDYELNGGEVVGDANRASYTVETETFTLNNPVRIGYIFDGWTENGLTSASIVITIEKGSSGNRNFIATWKDSTYTITYDGIAGIEIDNPTTYTISSNDIKLANPEKPNYEFAGWEGTGLTSASTEVTIVKGSTGDRRYTATWNAISYDITYEPNGGTMPTGEYANDYTVEDNVTLPIPTMPYYSFNGWYDASGNLVDGWKAGDKAAPMTLTAQWEKSFEDIEGFSHYGPTYGSRVLNCYDRITLQNYIACNHEVTQAEYKAIMGENPSRFNGEESFEPAESEIQSRRPVDSVSWFDAIYYCNKRSIAENLTPCYKVGNETDPTKWGYTPHNGDTIAATITCNFEVDGYRLPTEAEWEYIAIAGDPQLAHEGNYSYYYGDITSLWYNGNSDGKTHEMKKYAANDYGIYDLEGNVREWCWDWYLQSGWNWYLNYYGTEPDTCTNRVIRGGGWNSDKSDCDIFECYYDHPDARYGDCGFRVVRTAISDTKCTITYNTTGGTLIEPHTVWNGYFISSLPVPSRENYAFDGWYLDDAYTMSFDIEMDNIIVTQDFTLYAKWIWCKDGIQYDITDVNSKTCQISSVDQSYEGEFIIPEKVEIEGVDYTITRIGNGAFSNCKDITSITIPNTVTSIGERAFYFVEKEGGLTSLEIPESVTSIGSEAFYGCHYLERITLPSGITSIGDRWFCDCWHLKSINGSEDGTIVIPEGITSIGSNSFRNCQYDLKSVTIPDGVTSIGGNAFYDCKALESLSVPSSIEFVGKTAFPTYSGNQLPNHYNIADDGAKYLGNDENPYVVLIDGKSVTNLVIKDGCRFIYDCACSNLNSSNLISVQFPEGLKGIGESAFIWGKITGDINIPEGVTYIGYEAFFRCSKVQTFSVPNSVTSIGEEAFTFALYEDEYATLGEDLYTRDGNALYLGNETNPYLCLAGTTSDDITECTINSQCKFILNKAFYGCTSLILDVPETVTSIASNAFSGVRNINYNGPAGNAYDTWGAIVRNGHIEGDFIYSSEDRTVLLGYFGSGTAVVIPNTVTTISRNAFKGLSNLTSVTIPNSVTAIGSGAFNGCTGIRSLTIPDGVETIDYNYDDGYAFNGVGNINYNGPAIDLNKNNWGAATRNAIVVGDFIFEDDAHTKLIKYIGDGGGVEIPDGTITIVASAFNGCRNITSVNISTTVESIGQEAFRGCYDLESVNLSSVKSIGPKAFSFCNLTSLTIPESVESVGSEAFYYCDKLVTVNILSSGTTFDSGAFKDCKNLRNGYANFASYESLCSLQFEGGDGLANPLSMAKKLYIGGEAVTEVVIPDGITTIGRQTFFNAKNITSVSIPSSVTSIGDEAFRGCSSLTTITGANGLQNIGYKAFNECKFAQFEVPTSVTSIGNNAFDNCQSLSAIYIPANVTTMGSDVFLACNSYYLKVYCEAASKPEGWADEWNHWNNSKEMTVIWGVTRDADGFLFKNREIVGYTGNITENPTIPETSPDGSSITTIGNKVFCWSNISSINIPSTITSIGDSTFYGSGKLTSVTIPEGVTSIGRAAFCGCYSLTTINIPEGITSIADSLFCGCDALQQITFPSSVTSIGKMAFRYCDFTSFEIPSTVKTIGEGAFYACYYMTSVTIPEGVTSIGDYAFWSCDDLTSVTIPSTVTSIGESAFYDCELLASVTINEGVKSIGNRAFQSCDILTSVNIPSSVTSIGDEAFNYCPKLTSVIISESVTDIGEEAFSHCENLNEVHFKSNTPPANVGDNPFSNCSKAVFYVPTGSGDAYRGMPWAEGITINEEDL